MSLRVDFVTLASKEGANVRDLCRRFAISPKTGYKWLKRAREGGTEALCDRSRRPHSSPSRTPKLIEQTVLSLRDQHPVWGPRKLKALLPKEAAYQHLTASTVEAILKRHGRVDPKEAAKHKPWQRFQAEAPNDLWQMDFKGHFPLVQGGRCHPLTLLDDHSRFLLGLVGCPNETGLTVQAHLTKIFRCYGLPLKMLMDNGSPWGSDWEHRYTPLTVWLIRLGMLVSHSRAYHPQTIGKDERLNRTLDEEVLSDRRFLDLSDSQHHFDPWRDLYNCQRPHEALGMAVPASRYQPSPRAFPEHLPPIEYGPDFVVRKVQAGGEVSWQGKLLKVGKAFRGYPVGIRQTNPDGLVSVFFCQQQVAEIDLRAHNDHTLS